MRSNVAGVAILLFLGAPACVPERLSPSPRTWPEGLHECRIPRVDETLRCGRLEVFEDREGRAGRKISLSVVVIPALGPAVRPDPIFEIEGGPGLAAGLAAPFYVDEGAIYRRERDIVLVDQRGTGGSNALNCDFAADEPNPHGILDEMYPPGAVAACREKLSAVANLSLYTTPLAMDDLDDVRSWLGYDRINLIGLSYGTRAAMTYMARHPEHVRSAVLIGVAPTDLKIPLHHASDAQRAMDLLLQDCAADAACAGAFPNVRPELDELMAKLDREPARVPFVVPGSDEEIPLTIRREIFAEKLRWMLYSAATARRIPLIVHRAAAGDFEPFLRIALGEGGGPGGLAEGMYLSVTCPEDTRRIDPAEARSLTRRTFGGDYRVLQQTRACSMWPEAKVPAGYFEPFFTRAPVLIFSGYLDPVTAPRWAEEIAARLPHATLVRLRYSGHLPDGLRDAGCVDRTALAFFDRGRAEGLDVSCVDGMSPPPFALKL